MRIEIDPGPVGAAKETWMGLSQDLNVAVKILEDTPTTGFSSTVAPTVASFLKVWAGATTEMATNADDLSEDLQAVLEDFGSLEYNVADQLAKLERGIR